MTQPRKQQAQLLQDMGAITRMRRGHLTEQYNRKKDPDGTERRWGPYYTLQAWVGGKNRSERISADGVPQVRQDLENHAAFTELCERYVEVAEGIAKVEVADSKKKPRRSKPPSAGKSRSS
ncbi:MAG: hypothetical protein KKC18_16000 [Chloroflexi bacterium]|nr:hypothetical protein [Chloroflexota bacterium]MBU1695028.1 hypothetical protein [Verrucomicrobiota bacterium]